MEEWMAVCMWLLTREIPGEINPWNGEDFPLYIPTRRYLIDGGECPIVDLLAPQIEPGTDPKSQVKCNPWCCQRLVVQRYTNRPASFLKSSHLPYKLKSPLKRIPSSSNRINSPMEISCHYLDIKFLAPPNEHYRRIEDSRIQGELYRN